MTFSLIALIQALRNYGEYIEFIPREKTVTERRG